MTEIAAELGFEAGGNGHASLLAGWSDPEPEATWSLDGESLLRVPLRPGEGDLMLELAVKPFLAEPSLRRQRLLIAINGADIAAESVEAGTILGYRLPAAAARGRSELLVRLRHPDAVSPAALQVSTDYRRLGFALRAMRASWMEEEAPAPRRSRPPLPFASFDGSDAQLETVRGLTAIALPDLMTCFESLGHNCEFGLVQRRAGAETAGLLRFAGIQYRCLVEGLEAGFADVDDPAQLEAYPLEPVEFMMRHTRYGMDFHTFIDPATTTAAEVLATQAKLLRFRRAKFLDILASGEKLFVFQRPERMSEAQALPILTQLRRHGPNALLFVTRGTGAPAGTVQMLRPHLFQGSVDSLAPIHDAPSFDYTAWVSLCANAYRLWRETGGGAG